MSSSGVERTVRIGGMQYVDPVGVWRFGLQGATVRVHPDHVERFDRFNGAPDVHVPAPEATAPEAPKRRGPGRPRKVQSEE